ncbi:hypothetical protein HC864_01055 [Candidatus Gracilibacteria bacterium]|nr:hypothetical protein [Candidatus Gracilibacteria bacterium]
MNIPGGIQNRRLTLWQCNSNDPDQVFTITNVNTTPPPSYNYVFPWQNGDEGFLQDDYYRRVAIDDSQLSNGGNVVTRNANNFDHDQKMKFLPIVMGIFSKDQELIMEYLQHQIIMLKC